MEEGTHEARSAEYLSELKLTSTWELIVQFFLLLCILKNVRNKKMERYGTEVQTKSLEVTSPIHRGERLSKLKINNFS